MTDRISLLRTMQLEVKESRGRSRRSRCCARRDRRKFGRLLEVRETEERRDRSRYCRVDGAYAHLDFFFGLLDVAGVGVLGQILVRPGVAADGHAGGGNQPAEFGMPDRVFADFKERRLETLIGQRLDDRRGVFRPRPVVESQHHFVLAQEIVLLEMLAAECGTAGRVDLDDPRKTQAALALSQAGMPSLAAAHRGCSCDRVPRWAVVGCFRTCAGAGAGRRRQGAPQTAATDGRVAATGAQGRPAFNADGATEPGVWSNLCGGGWCRSSRALRRNRRARFVRLLGCDDTERGKTQGRQRGDHDDQHPHRYSTQKPRQPAANQGAIGQQVNARRAKHAAGCTKELNRGFCSTSAC